MTAPLPANTLASPFDAAMGRVIDAAFEAIVTVDEQGRIVMINPAAQRMFGCTAAEVLGSDLSRFIPARWRDAHARHVREFDASGAVELPMSRRPAITGLRANGEEFPAEASVSRLDVVGEFGPRRYFTVLLRDLGETRSLQAELDALRRALLAIFEQAPVAIWIIEGERIVFANRACAGLFGAGERESIVGRSIDSLLSASSHAAVREQVAQALAGRVPVPVVGGRIERLDGAQRQVEIATAALPDHSRAAVQMVITDMTERARRDADLERSRSDLRRLSASLVDAREEERRRIARELHDELGQRLTALKMELSSLALQTPAGAGGERIASMLDMVDETVASVRRISTELRPLMLDDLGLNAAIEWLARESARRTGIDVTLRLGEVEPPVGAAAAIALYRIVQEALTNVVRHARATRVRIDLRRQADELVLTVQDNGVGLSAQAMHREGSHGLMGIRERAYMLGGQFEVGASPGGGGCLTVRLPCAAGDEPARTHGASS